MGIYSWDSFGSVPKATRHLRITVGTWCCRGLPDQDTQCEANKDHECNCPGDHHLDQAFHQCLSDLVAGASQDLT